MLEPQAKHMDYNITIEQETFDTSALDAIFTKPEDVLTPFVEEIKPTNILEDNSVDKALDNVTDTKEKPEHIAPITTREVEAVLDTATKELEPETEVTESKKEPGRPKTEKNALVTYLSKKVEANEFGIPEDEPYDSSKQTISEYLSTQSEEKLHGLLDSNVKAQIDEVRAQTPKEFFESLPEELQYAAAYVADGGQDLKGLFKALSHVEEVRELDPEKEQDQIAITRSYLQATGWKEEAINEQIEEWKELAKIEKKAKEFKPELDNMQKQQVQAYQKQAAEQKKYQQELAQFYAQNVYKQLETNELAGIKLDKKVAREMENGLLTVQPGPWSGKPMNSLGYGLEKVQYIEPDYEAVLLATWLLNDKKGFLEAMGTAKANQAVEKTAKLIKMNQGLGVSEQITIREPQKAVKRIPNTSNVLKRQLA